MSVEADGFLSRWSRRKVLVRQGVAAPEPAAVEPAAAATAAAAAPGAVSPPPRVAAITTVPVALAAPADVEPAAPAEAEPTPPAPTMADVATLTRDSDYARFMAPGVDGGVKNAALKKLFTDPHFNLMDRLDTYIDDYNTPDPLPASWLRKMTQSAALGLFDDEEKDAKAPANADPVSLDPPGLEPAPLPIESADPSPHENPDLRLQQDDAAGQPRIDGGAEQNAGRQH